MKVTVSRAASLSTSASCATVVKLGIAKVHLLVGVSLPESL